MPLFLRCSRSQRPNVLSVLMSCMVCSFDNEKAPRRCCARPRLLLKRHGAIGAPARRCALSERRRCSS